MNLQINKDWRIRTDNYNYMLEKRTNVQAKDKDKKVIPGEYVWNTVGHYTSLNNAVSAYPETILKRSDAEGIAEAVQIVKDACKELSSALSPKFEVRLK